MSSKPDVIQAQGPTPGQSAKEYAQALPSILQAQLQYQPQFDAQQYQSFAQLAPQYAQVNQDVLNQFSPNQAQLGEQLSAQALDLSQNGLSQDELKFFEDRYKALVGDASSPIGASAISSALIEQNMQAKQFGQNLGLSLQNKAPITQAYQPASNFNVAGGFQNAFATQTAGTQSFMGASPLEQYGQLAQGIGSIFGGK